MAQLKDTTVTGNIAVSGSATIGGGAEITGGDLDLYVGTGDSPAVIFKRGTLTDNYNDWRIQDRGGYFYIDERGINSSTWTNRMSINTTGVVTASTFSGDMAWDNITNKPGLTTSDIAAGTDETNKLVSAKTLSEAIGSAGGGTVTSVTISGTSPISASGTVTSTGTLTVSHENSGVTEKTTQALYPFKVNKTGHITSVGTAVTVPTAGTTATAVSTTSSGGSATTWSKSDHVHSISSSTITSALGYSPAGKDIASSFANGLMSSSDKIKLDGLSPTGQVQADWSVSDSTSGAFIKNKPTDLGDFANVYGGYYNSSSNMVMALSENTFAQQYVMTVSGNSVTLSNANIGSLYYLASSALKQLFYYVDFQTGEAHIFEIVRFNVTSFSPLTVASVELASYHNGVLETIVLADDPNVNQQMIGTLSTKTIPSNVSDLANDAGYLTQTTLGAALQANTAIIYEITYTEPTFWTSGSYAIADTLANVVANISSDRKVIFRQSLDTGKYNYWQPWFNNPNSNKIGLYRFEKDGGKLYHVVFEPDSGGTGLTGTEVGPYYLNQYDPYAVGKIITTSSISDDPNDYLDGSWTLIDKEFISRNRYDVTSAAVSANTTNTNSVSLVASRMGHDLYLQATINNKVAINTTNLELFTLKTSGEELIGLNALGLSTRIDVSYFHFLGYCDNANAAAMMDIDYSGRVRSLNVITRGSATSISAGNTITATFTLHSPAQFMLDSYCDKFYWRRDS